ncbi:MAG: guanylate kinase [Cytophagales bacterium]|nr:MAG: guanylate kinase [Cytophagales bacterium]TAF60299.1 MAG: guanylate kinase [Cytophagales bacterium]
MKKGKLIVFSAPSGAGKTTIVKHLLNCQRFQLAFSVSATTRRPRVSERSDLDYYFIESDDFLSKVKAGEFLEYQQVYEGFYYGTLKSEITRLRNLGKNIIFDVDVHGGLNIKAMYPDDCLAVFVSVPSLDVLEERLRKRNTETEEQFKMRLQKAQKEISLKKHFDAILVNDKLEQTLQEAEAMLDKYLS